MVSKRQKAITVDKDPARGEAKLENGLDFTYNNSYLKIIIALLLGA